MTSGKRTELAADAADAAEAQAATRAAALARRRFLALGALAAGALAVGEPATAQGAGHFDLQALMTLLAQRKSGEARFTEERTVTGFDSPLRASGTLSFTAPDRFARQTLEPQRERMEVAGNQVRLERGTRVRQMALDAVPELAALVEGLRGTLSGNGALLRQHFEVRVTGQARLWTLTLTPRDSALAAQVRLLQIVGTGAELRTVELQLAGGDRSLMTIEAVATLTPAAPTSAAPISAAPISAAPTPARASAAATAPAAGSSR